MHLNKKTWNRLEINVILYFSGRILKMKFIALVCVVMCLTFNMASTQYYYGKGLMSVLSKQAEALYRGLMMASSEDGGMLNIMCNSTLLYTHIKHHSRCFPV